MILNIIVLIFEVLYYSMFMYYARKEGKFWRYLLLFSLITIIGAFIGTNNILSYLLLILLITFGIKYIIKIKVGLYDMFFVFIMMFLKIIIESILAFTIFYTINNYTILLLSLSIIKFIIVILLKSKISIIYIKLKRFWHR